MKTKVLLMVPVLALCTSSCVTKEKYLLAESGRQEAQTRADRLASELNLTRSANDRLNEELVALRRILHGWEIVFVLISRCWKVM